MKDIIEFLKSHKYYLVVAILVFTSILLSVTFSSYIVTSNDHKAAEMYIGELKYSIEIDGNRVNNISVPSGETIVDVKVNNHNPVDTYYKLLYLKNTNITVKYYESTKDTKDVVTTYNKPNDSITSSNSNIVKLLITNNSASSQNIALTMKGGYITNTLSDITTPSTYSEITLAETPSANTYFCKTNDTLTQGREYINGQYTYRYKQEGSFPSSGLAWSNLSRNGWGVQLTDKSSISEVNSKLCSFINNKPIIAMSYMFYTSQAPSIDVSSFNTSKVTSMNEMFYSSEATNLDLSNFDTSNVTNMKRMFIFSKATIINVSSFDTSKVTDMNAMFYKSPVNSLNISNFDTSNVTDMSEMFADMKNLTTLDLNSFNTSKVTNMSNMFRDTVIINLDLSSFDTSKVINMNRMFEYGVMSSINLSSFDTSKVTDMGNMFENSKITNLDLSSFDTSNVTTMRNMFANTELTVIDLSNFNTSKVTDMVGMFDGSKNLKTIYVSDKFNTNKVTLSNKMFNGCTKLVGGSGTKYNSSKIDKTYAHIDGGTSNPGYFTDIAEKDFPTKAGIYIRNSSPKGLETVSRDGLYRFVGSSNNYVSMGGVSYRIIGITDDSEINSNLGIEANQLKLIKTSSIEKKEWVNDGMTDYPWGNIGNTLYWHLQQDILSNTSYIPSSWNSKISLVNWYIGDTKTGSVSSISSSERSTVTSKQSKLGLMYLSDYFYSNVAGGTTNCYTTKCSRSWLNNSSKTQWTMSRYGAMSNMGYFAWTIETTYNNSPLKVNNTSTYYSPVFFLDKTIYISGGSGTSSDPFILEYNKDYYFVTVYLTGNYYGLYRVKKGNEINLDIYSGNPLKYSTCSNAKYSLSVDSNKINHITIKSITDDAYCYLEYNF